MSEQILMIETSTDCCSVALCNGYNIVSKRIGNEPKIHAAMTAPFIEDVLKEASIGITEIDAVAVSEGPGSYTGLRVGVSTAKGVCFGASKPLISIDTLEILAYAGKNHPCKPEFIIPFIDARRMEVYSARFDSECNKLTDTEAIILDVDSFSDILEQKRVLFIGTGIAKFKEICNSKNAFFEECYPKAEHMTIPALNALKHKEFKDVAYFEPFYLKEFTPGISKKSVLPL